MKGVSVIICCYNSEKLLAETLSYLSKQKIDATFSVEIIVVDNASTDNTSNTAALLWSSLHAPFNLIVVHEPTPGLSYAREAGIRASSFDILLFCDDDNLLSSDYIQQGYSFLQSDEQIALLGGRGFAKIDAHTPPWFEKYAYQYAVGPQAETSKDITLERGFIYGAGSFLNKKAYDQLKRTGFEYTLTGRKGESLTSGEDNELGYALSLLGYKIHYLDSLTFIHIISEKRIQWEYIKRLKKSVAFSTVLLIPYIEFRRKKNNPVLNSFSWPLALVKHTRVLCTNILRYPFASASYKIDIALDTQSRLGAIQALIEKRKMLCNSEKWLPWYMNRY